MDTSTYCEAKVQERLSLEFKCGFFSGLSLVLTSLLF